MIHQDYHELKVDKCYRMWSESRTELHIVYNLGQIVDPKDCVIQTWSSKNYYALKTIFIADREVFLHERLINAFLKTMWSKEEISLDEFNLTWIKELV